MLKYLVCFSLISSAASANGLTEARPWQFRSPSERQILLSGEQTRLNFKIFERSQAAAGAAAGGQTGNSLSITINGDGDNTIDTGQDNNGNQTIQEASGTASNTISDDTSAAVDDAAARLLSIQGSGN